MPCGRSDRYGRAVAKKRDTSAQRRARENRARREALAARTAGAVPARPSRVAPSTAERLSRTREPGGTRGGRGAEDRAVEVDAGAEERRGRKGRAARPRRPRPGDVPVDPAKLEGSWLSRVNHVPGGTQVLMAGVLTLVITVMLFVVHSFYEDGVEPGEGPATLTLVEAVGLGPALALVAVPLVLVGLSLAFALRRQRRRVWMFAALVLGVFVLQGPIYYLFVVGFLGYALIRAAKVEGPNEPLVRSFLNRQRGRRPDTVTEGETLDADRSPEGDAR